MKNFLIYFSVIIGVILVILTIFIWLYYSKVGSNMREKSMNVKKEWNKFYELRGERNLLMNDILKISEENKINSDSLLLAMSEANKLKVKDSCSMDFVYGEYKINNKEFLNLLRQENSKEIESLEVFKKMNINTEELNKAKDIYNERVKDYNVYVIRLPNSIIARKEGYYQQKYFNITYGQDNEDPIKKQEKYLSG